MIAPKHRALTHMKSLALVLFVLLSNEGVTGCPPGFFGGARDAACYPCPPGYACGGGSAEPVACLGLEDTPTEGATRCCSASGFKPRSCPSGRALSPGGCECEAVACVQGALVAADAGDTRLRCIPLDHCPGSCPQGHVQNPRTCLCTRLSPCPSGVRSALALGEGFVCAEPYALF